jgi:hypothetical protein
MGDVFLKQNDTAAALENYAKALAIAEDLISKNPSDTYSRRDLSDCYERLARAHARQSAGLKSSRAEQVARWRLARSFYQKSLNIWNEWTAWSVSNSYSERRRLEAQRTVNECDAALNRLGARQDH